MSPRPRATTDADLLDGAYRAISRVGPARLTLADVAREVGVSPATLVQRFGSKRRLLLALVEQGHASVDACFDAARASHGSPTAALVAAATDMTRYVESPEALANHLAFLQIDLSDPEFHRPALEYSRRVLAGYRALLEAATATGELVLPAGVDSTQLARAVQATAGGSLINWAIHRDGSVEQWVRDDLETLLRPYRAAQSTAPARRAD
jgi:AcrR family transcriptional regulator